MSIHEDETTAAASSTDGGSTKTVTEDTTTSPNIDLRTCTPGELSAFLLANRFQGNAIDVATFLLSCTSTLPNAEEISAQLLGGCDDDDDDEDEEMEDNNEEKKDDTEHSEDAKQPAAVAVAEAKQSAKSTLLQSITSSQPHPTFAKTNTNIEVSCINPRGKFQLSVYKNGLVLTNPKKSNEEHIPISNDNIKQVIWFRKPEDYKKMKQFSKNGNGNNNKGVPGHMVLICLEEGKGGIMFRDKPLKQVCFQLPMYPAPSTADGTEGVNAQLTEENWWNALTSSLFTGSKSGDCITRVHATIDKPEYVKGKFAGEFVFQSEGESGSGSTTTEHMPYVGCYHGFNDGALFPMKEGLLFFKPPLFVPRSKLTSISCGRGSGSRYVDMLVQLDVASSDSTDEQEGKKKKKQTDSLEFTNIHRDELNGLNDYIHQTLIPAMQMDADGSPGGDASSDGSDDEDVAVAEVVNTSDDDDDDEEGCERKRRPARAASKSAREINRAALNSAQDDEEDDDSDEFEEEDESDASGDNESVISADGVKSDGSSFEDEDFEEEEMNDSDDGLDYDDQKSKKPRIE